MVAQFSNRNLGHALKCITGETRLADGTTRSYEGTSWSYQVSGNASVEVVDVCLQREVRQLRSAGDERGHDVAGVAIQVVAGPVVSSGGPGVGVAGSDLNIAEGHPCIQTGSERCSNHVECPVLPGVG